MADEDFVQRRQGDLVGERTAPRANVVATWDIVVTTYLGTWVRNKAPT